MQVYMYICLKRYVPLPLGDDPKVAILDENDITHLEYDSWLGSWKNDENCIGHPIKNRCSEKSWGY